MKTHLLTIYWKRPSPCSNDGFVKDVMTIKCNIDEVDNIVKYRLEKCVSEGYGREITNIKLYKLEEVTLKKYEYECE